MIYFLLKYKLKYANTPEVEKIAFVSAIFI